MDKIARIRAELKRRREDILSKVEHRPIHRIELLDDLLSFLDTLSKEPDIPEFPETFEICLYDGRTPDNEKCTECSTTCSVRKEELDKSLEEAADEYENGYYDDCSAAKRAAYHGFIAGWKCRDDQMLKDAVEGKVNQDGFLELSNGEVIDICPTLKRCALGLHIGDKVRIVVLKEEE